MSIQVIRNVIGLEKEHVHSGYGEINWSLAINFLDYVANQYAREQRLTIRNADRIIEDKDHRERILSDHEGTDVVRFFLKIKK